MFSSDEDWGGSDEEDLDARYGIGAGADTFDDGDNMFDVVDTKESSINNSMRPPGAPKSPTPNSLQNKLLQPTNVTPDSAKSSLSEVEYRVISTTDVLHEQNELIVSVSDVLQVPRSAALAMLLWSGWSKERLLEKYMGGNTAASKVCTDAGVTELVRVSRSGASPVVPSPGSLRCNICYEESGATDMSGLSCGHRFCGECWNAYLHNRVQEGSTSIFTSCPMEKCTEMCTEDMFQRFGGAAEFLVYRKYLAESYVDINSRIRWCPGKGCEKAIVATFAGVRDVKCVCGTEFCFRCQEEAHFPLTCQEREEWTERCDLESGAANWILENTKKCPECSTRIEKNSGCNKISCNSAGCGHAFCWICLGPWSEHGRGNYYACNKFVKKKNGASNKENRGSVNGGAEGGENDRFLHFFKRYTVHQKAQEFSEKYLIKARDRTRALRKKGKTSIHIDQGEFYIDAARTVVRCRRLLKYSYAFAYGLMEKEGGDQAMEVFTYMQSNLESNTEALSEMSEKPLEEVDRDSMLNFVACTNTLVDNLRKGIQGGLASSAYTRILRFTTKS
jgi:ariadne-1